MVTPIPRDRCRPDPIRRCANGRDLDARTCRSDCCDTGCGTGDSNSDSVNVHRNAPAPAGTTVVLKRNQFAVVGGLLLALVVGVVVLAIVALRRPTTVIMAPAETAATEAPGGSPRVLHISGRRSCFGIGHRFGSGDDGLANASAS